MLIGRDQNIKAQARFHSIENHSNINLVRKNGDLQMISKMKHATNRARNLISCYADKQ